MPRDTESEKAYALRECAQDLLARREHSQVELKRKLMAKGFENLEIENLLVTLAKEGLQSDERFAEAYVHHRVDMGFGPRRIECELLERGLSQSLIQQYLPQDNAFWQERMALVWQKKYHAKDNFNQRDYVKQACFLQQRGFESSEIVRWLNEVRRRGYSCQGE